MADIRLPLLLSFYLMVFLALPGAGQNFQMASLSLLVLQCVLLQLGKLRWPFATGAAIPPGSRLSPIGLLLIYLIPLESLLANIGGPDLYYAEYSLLFFVVTLAVLSITNDLDFRTVLNSFAGAGVAVLVTLLATSADELRFALSIHIDPAAGLTRYSPLGLHPNLLGHICGAFAVVYFCYFLHLGAQRLLRYINLLLAGVSLLICIATSSRGGTLSALVAIVFLQLLAIWNDRRLRRNFFLVLGLLVAALLSSGAWRTLQGYLSAMLAFDNAYRGVDSGLSGRTDNWQRLLDDWLGSPQSILIGNGLRTGSEELLGYNIDNGYLTMLYESGTVATTLFVLFLIVGLARLTLSIRQRPDLVKSAACGLFIFILLESAVARYLLSLGNPASLLVIYCMLGLKVILNTGADRGTGNVSPAWSSP
jgi:hypothetical protein